jgi:FMN reductase
VTLLQGPEALDHRPRYGADAAMNGPKLVGLCGSPQRPSRTRMLVEAIVDAVGARLKVRSEILGVDEVWPTIGVASLRAALPPEGEAVIRAIETADLLVVGTPVYRASYTGALKHIFDLVDQFALTGKPVILSATGGSERHTLMIEHQLRPLMGFFGAASVSTGVYATERDFTGYRLTNPNMARRIAQAAREAAHMLGAGARQVETSG